MAISRRLRSTSRRRPGQRRGLDALAVDADQPLRAGTEEHGVALTDGKQRAGRKTFPERNQPRDGVDRGAGRDVHGPREHHFLQPA